MSLAIKGRARAFAAGIGAPLPPMYIQPRAPTVGGPMILPPARQMRALRAGKYSGWAMRGDPGIGDILGGVLGTAGSFLPGPLGGIASGLAGLLGGKPSVASQMGIKVPFGTLGGGPQARLASAAEQLGIGPPMPGGGQGYPPPRPTPAAPFPQTVNGGPPGPGYHLNKSSYYRMSPAGTVVHVPKGSVWVKNRRRNPLNPRALDRAMGRLSSAKRAATKLGRISIRKSCKR